MTALCMNAMVSYLCIFVFYFTLITCMHTFYKDQMPALESHFYKDAFPFVPLQLVFKTDAHLFRLHGHLQPRHVRLYLARPFTRFHRIL